MFRNKPPWFDTVIGILGLIIGIIPLLTDYLPKGFFKENILYLNFGVAIIIIFLSIFFKSNQKLTVDKLSTHDFYTKIKSYSGYLNNVLICNPNNNGQIFTELHKYMIEANNIKLSYLGDANSLMYLFKNFAENELLKGTNTNFLSSHSQDYMIIVMNNDNLNEFVIGIIHDQNYYLSRITDNNSIEIIKSLYKKEILYKNCIDLDHISQPVSFLDIVNSEREKYLRNFKDLKTGHISFYGTEVLNIQSGWLESGKFKEINTLDLTKNPALLKTRKRYNKANEVFIKNGGKVRRVYMIWKHNLNDKDFVKDLWELMNYQKEIGVQIGLQFLDDLTHEQKQDFILYDQFAVLVEERQANSDYTFGKSTAYFHQDKVKYYQQVFDTVWNGYSIDSTPAENARKFLIEYKGGCKDADQHS